MASFPRIFVTGHPIFHSLSPYIHKYWLDFYGLRGSYEAVDTDEKMFPGFIHSLLDKGFCGGNVTLPHKEKAFMLSERLDEAACLTKAVNTLWFEKEILHGSNTDVYGFSCNLDDFLPEWKGDAALVIGAGGASRAILLALKQRGYKTIFLSNRTRSRAENLAEYFGPEIVATDWHNVNDRIAGVDLVVNTTSLGMASYNQDKKENLSVDFLRANSGTVVTDIVYTPLETPFLRKAREAGLFTINGIGMLLHQAVPGFEKWFGIRPKVTKELRFLILSLLGEQEP